MCAPAGELRPLGESELLKGAGRATFMLVYVKIIETAVPAVTIPQKCSEVYSAFLFFSSVEIKKNVRAAATSNCTLLQRGGWGFFGASRHCRTTIGQDNSGFRQNDTGVSQDDLGFT